MRCARLSLMLLMVLWIIPWELRAQMSRKSLSTRQMSQMVLGVDGSTADEKTCQFFIDTPFTKDVPTSAFTNLDQCVDALDQNIPDPGGLAADHDMAISTLKTTYGLTSPDQIDEQLITTHFLSRLLRRWASLDSNGEADQLAILDSVDNRLHVLMTFVGLLDPLAGSLVAGPAFGETGKLSPASTSTGTGGSSTGTVGTAPISAGSNTNALAHIEWGSKHFFDETWSPLDLSFGGSFGLQPALTLLTNPPPATGTTPTPSPTTTEYQSAFVWDLNGRANAHTGTEAELSVLFRVGQLRLLNGNGATVVDQGANSTLQIPLNGNANKMSWFYEGGVEWNYYSKSLEIVHAEKGQLDPAFKVGMSYRIDSRFNQSAGVVGFDSPDRRLVFRFMINGLKVFDRRPDTTTSKPYAVSFGVEYERGFGGNPIPSGTTLIIRGDINLLKLINPGSGS
jgi:hypothetical protein